VARARQRAAVDTFSEGTFDGRTAASPETGLGHPWALLGVVAIGTGGFALSHGATMHADDANNPEATRRTRRHWYVAGIALLIVGIVALAQVS
jgi:hypothetical protein